MQEIMRKKKLSGLFWRLCLLIIVIISIEYSNVILSWTKKMLLTEHKDARIYDKLVVRPKHSANIQEMDYYENKFYNAFPHRVLNESNHEIDEEDFLRKISANMNGVTKDPMNLQEIHICIAYLDYCMNYADYKKFKAKEFVNQFANPFSKSAVPPTLRAYSEDQPRPDPLLMVKDTSQTYNRVLIKQELEKEKIRRMKLGDDDILQMPEVQTILSRAKAYRIPDIVHFIWFGCHRYRIHHYTSMISVLRYQIPSLILFHTNCTPVGIHWDAFKNAAKGTLKIVRRSPPLQIFGNNIMAVEHQSDVARLQILLEVGGIYMDDDIIVLKSLNDLRTYPMVLGEENYDALANSIIMAANDAWFLHRWFQEYKRFNGSRWSDSSCFVPWSLWRLFPNTIKVVKEKMLRPNWEEIDYIYRELWDWRKSYTIHLFSRFMEAVDGTKERSLSELAILNTTYGEISRHAIWGNFEIQDISEDMFSY